MARYVPTVASRPHASDNLLSQEESRHSHPGARESQLLPADVDAVTLANAFPDEAEGFQDFCEEDPAVQYGHDPSLSHFLDEDTGQMSLDELTAFFGDV